MTEHEQRMEERFALFEREARRRDRIIEILLGVVVTLVLMIFAIGGWTAVRVVDNTARIAVIENRLDNIETRLGDVETRLARVEVQLAGIQSALNILVARKNGAAGSADAGESKQSKLAPGQGKFSTEPGQLATR